MDNLIVNTIKEVITSKLEFYFYIGWIQTTHNEQTLLFNYIENVVNFHYYADNPTDAKNLVEAKAEIEERLKHAPKSSNILTVYSDCIKTAHSMAIDCAIQSYSI